MAEENKDIDEIIVGFLLDQLDDHEKEILENWLAESEDNQLHFETIKAVWTTPSPEPRAIHAQDAMEKIWREGLGEEYADLPRRRSFMNYFLRMASAILFVVAAFVATQKFINRKDNTPRYIVRENSASERSQFMLPDGSMVWLHCKSSLRYPENFAPGERKMELSGEAFFEVKKDASRPFIVQSGSLSTTALGTSFNVACYPEKKVIDVSLFTGVVEVKNKDHGANPVLLNPGTGVRYDHGDHTMTQHTIDAERILAWKSGILIFDGDDFEEFTRKIKQWYDVTISLEGNVPDAWNIRGQFDNQPLTNVLDLVSFNKNFTYELKDKHLVLRF
jgi:transmembrane sensor